MNDSSRRRRYSKKFSHLKMSHLKSIIELTTDAILIINKHGQITYFNRTFSLMWGISIKKSCIAVASKIKNKITGEHLIWRYVWRRLKYPSLFFSKTLFSQNYDENKSFKNCSIIFKELELKDGRILECYYMPKISKTKITNDRSLLIIDNGRVFRFRDVTEKKKRETELVFKATHDHLTRLPNRALLFDRINEAIRNSESDFFIFAVIYLDLNRFKVDL